MSDTTMFLSILVCAICSFIPRVLPFLCFGGKKEVPRTVTYLGNTLPMAVMAVLVIYCIKSVSLSAPRESAFQRLAVAVAMALHWWKNSPLLSIGVSTILYMVLLRL